MKTSKEILHIKLEEHQIEQYKMLKVISYGKLSAVIPYN